MAITPANRTWLAWIGAHAVGLPAGFILALIPFLSTVYVLRLGDNSGVLAWSLVSLIAGGFLGFPLGTLQWLTVRRFAPTQPWILATLLGVGTGMVAFFILAPKLADSFPPLWRATQSMTSFGTLNSLRTPNELEGVLLQGLLWLLWGALVGGFVGLAQWSVQRRRAWLPWRWIVLNAVVGAVALTAGSALRGLVFDVSGAYDWVVPFNDDDYDKGIGAYRAWLFISILVGLTATGLLWGLGTWPLLKRQLSRLSPGILRKVEEPR